LTARLKISAASAADFPRTGLPEIALVGRSNVGKSSLINALVKQKIARTSAAPGKTRLANYYEAQSPLPSYPSLYLVDLPGYGYARGGAESAESFEVLTQEFFDRAQGSGRSLAGIFHLIDARHPALKQDAAAHEWLLRQELPIAIVATKMDKLAQREQAQTVKALAGNYGALVLPVSAMKAAGLPQVWKTIQEWTVR
jgi:GTP-binding protein